MNAQEPNRYQPPVALGLEKELALATRLAREAGDILKTFYEVPPVVRWKDSREPVTDADRAINAYLVSQIMQAFPADGILAEESADDMTRLHRKRVWMIDPIDGTTEFIARNNEFCIMIGLVEDEVPIMGVIYQPIDGLLFSAARGSGAFLDADDDRSQLHVSRVAEMSRLRPVVTRTNRTPILDDLIKALGVQRERVVGSIGVKATLIARGQADFYLHPGSGPKEWDTCAPEVILREAGGQMTDCWGRPLTYNRRDVARKFGVLASNGVIHGRLVAALDGLLEDAGVDNEFGF